MTVISGPYDPNGSDEQGRLSLDGKRYSHLLQVGMLKALYYWYMTPVLRGHLWKKEKMSF